MRWQITKEAWALAKRQFPGAKSLYMSLPVRFKMSGEIPVHDLSSKSEVGSISYRVVTSTVKSLIVLQCREEQVSHELPPARMMTFATAMTKEVLGAPSASKPKPFNYKLAKPKTEKNVKDFPATVHVVLDGNAMVVADVLQVKRIRHKKKKYEWWEVQPAGSSRAYWVLSDFIRPIKAGTVVAATSPYKQIPVGMIPVSSFDEDEIIWLRDKKGELFGPLYVITKKGDEVVAMPTSHGLSLYPGMESNFGDFRRKSENDEPVSLKEYEVLAGEWRHKSFGDVKVDEEFKFLGDNNRILKKKDDANAVSIVDEAGRQVQALDPVYVRDPNFHISGYDPWRQITGPENQSALEEAKRSLEPGTAVRLRSRRENPVETVGTFEKWEEIKNPLNRGKSGMAMVIRIDDTGRTVKVVPTSSMREWDVKAYGSKSIDESFREGHIWAICDDPIMDDPMVRGNLVKAVSPGSKEAPEKIVAIISINGDVVLARAGEILVKVPKSSLKPAFKSDKGLNWVAQIQSKRHPYREGDVLLRDGTKYIVIDEPTQHPLWGLYYQNPGHGILVRTKIGAETMIPNDDQNEYMGISLGAGQVAMPTSIKSKALRPSGGTEKAKEPSQNHPPAPPPPSEV